MTFKELLDIYLVTDIFTINNTEYRINYFKGSYTNSYMFEITNLNNDDRYVGYNDTSIFNINLESEEFDSFIFLKEMISLEIRNNKINQFLL